MMRMGATHPRQTASPAVTDLVCGMMVDPAQAVSLECQGATYYFCSQACADKFSENPRDYLTPPGSGIKAA